MEGVDYSYARPGAQCLYDAGKRFAVRYVGPNTDSGKWLRKGEFDALRSAGLLICLVYQTTASFMLNGYDEGVRAGQRSIAMADGLGIKGRPFYYALDTDTSPFGSSQWNAVKAFLDGAASVTGRNRVGIYGDNTAMDVLVPTWAPYGWQTYAWSGGNVSSKAALYQYKNGVNLCNGAVDLCKNLKPDFGQWPFAGAVEDDMTPAEHQMLVDAEARSAATLQLVRDLVEPRTKESLILDREIAGLVRDGSRLENLSQETTIGVRALLARDLGSVDVDEAAVAAAVLAQLTPESIAAAIPEQLASDVASELATRLQA